MPTKPLDHPKRIGGGELHGTPPAAVLAQRARVDAIRNPPPPMQQPASSIAPGRPPVAASEVAAPSTSVRCVLQFDAPLDFVRVEFDATDVTVDADTVTVLFRSDWRLHLGDLKPKLSLSVAGSAYPVAYLGGMFFIQTLGLRGMTFVRILPEA